MLGIIVILLISWGLVWDFEKKSLLVLGISPPGKRVLQFLTGFILTAILCAALQWFEGWHREAKWSLNPDFRLTTLLQMLWWDFRSVLTEELIFRGAILFILIKRIGTKYALLLSAIAFGIYHWFSFGLWDNVVPMIVIFTGTGIMGYALALAYSKTGSLALPVGIHLGWNFTLNTIFSKGPLDNGLILSTTELPPDTLSSLIGLIGAPLLIWLCIKTLVPEVTAIRDLRKMKKARFSEKNRLFTSTRMRIRNPAKNIQIIDCIMISVIPKGINTIMIG